MRVKERNAEEYATFRLVPKEVHHRRRQIAPCGSVPPIWPHCLKQVAALLRGPEPAPVLN
ncbi:hypothetical protein C1J02_20535 [Sulfitobacter sp. SK011]|nr:hypothetical protein C1J02_20535 [Sulfitobacter sp. SK011]